MYTLTNFSAPGSRPVFATLAVCILAALLTGATALEAQPTYGIEARVANTSLLIDLAAGDPPATISASGHI